MRPTKKCNSRKETTKTTTPVPFKRLVKPFFVHLGNRVNGQQ
jgi:hypothetical protein